MSVIGQIAAENPLATYGLAGILLSWALWFINQLRQDLKDLAHRLDGLTRALLVDMAERDSIGERTKQYCRDAIAAIDARNK